MPSHEVKSIDEASCIVRGTHGRKGRSLWISPATSATSYLHFSRIILEARNAPICFSNQGHETGLICLKGAGTIRVAGNSTFSVSPYDGLYVPRNLEIEVTPSGEGCDLAEISSPVDHDYPLQFVRFADVQQEPALSFKTGGAASARHLNIVLGKNIQAGRIVAGVTFSEPGNWTSWPPHEHAEMLEEAYLFIAMPEPAWGIQFVYTDPKSPELITAVREGDCIIMPQGYHPNVAAPGGSINFLWMMAARQEVVDRKFGSVNVQPEYAAVRSGLESGR